MLFTSPVYSQASGSIAGITYGHGRSGMFTRARSKPTDPNSFRQAQVRQIMASLMPKWGKTLQASERAAWDLYGANVPWSNALGQTIFLTGHQHFLRCNAPRLQSGIAIVLDAPTVYDLGTYTQPTVQLINTDRQLALVFTNTDDWATAVGGYLLCWPGRPCNASRNYYRSPWRYGGKVAGAVIPPGSPGLINVRWPCALGNKIWAYCRIIQVDGRLSPPIMLDPTIITEGGKAQGNPNGEPNPVPPDNDDEPNPVPPDNDDEQ